MFYYILGYFAVILLLIIVMFVYIIINCICLYKLFKNADYGKEDNDKNRAKGHKETNSKSCRFWRSPTYNKKHC